MVILKRLTLSLFAYVVALFAIKVPWGEAILGVLVPRVTLSSAFMAACVAGMFISWFG